MTDQRGFKVGDKVSGINAASIERGTNPPAQHTGIIGALDDPEGLREFGCACVRLNGSGLLVARATLQHEPWEASELLPGMRVNGTGAGSGKLYKGALVLSGAGGFVDVLGAGDERGRPRSLRLSSIEIVAQPHTPKAGEWLQLVATAPALEGEEPPRNVGERFLAVAAEPSTRNPGWFWVRGEGDEHGTVGLYEPCKPAPYRPKPGEWVEIVALEGKRNNYGLKIGDKLQAETPIEPSDGDPSHVFFLRASGGFWGRVKPCAAPKPEPRKCYVPEPGERVRIVRLPSKPVNPTVWVPPVGAVFYPTEVIAPADCRGNGYEAAGMPCFRLVTHSSIGGFYAEVEPA